MTGREEKLWTGLICFGLGFKTLFAQKAYHDSAFFFQTDFTNSTNNRCFMHAPSSKVDELTVTTVSPSCAHSRPYSLWHCLRPDLITSAKLLCVYKPKFHLARLDSTRLDTFDFVESVEPVEQVETSVSSETSRAVPTWRTTNKLVQV